MTATFIRFTCDGCGMTIEEIGSKPSERSFERTLDFAPACGKCMTSTIRMEVFRKPVVDDG